MRLRHVFTVLLSTPACGGIIDATRNAMPDAAADAIEDATTDAIADATADAMVDAGTGACHVGKAGWLGCTWTQPIIGDPTQCGLLEAGVQPASICQSLCDPKTAYCSWLDSGDLYCDLHCAGRRTDGLIAEADGFAGMAELEAISVIAFRRLARELAIHGAPDQLRWRCRRAAREEVRHARIMARFARTAIRWPRIRRLPARPLVEVAVENAIEGCIRETWGALFGAWQAEHAADSNVRMAMRAVAHDELGHAELSWAIHRWAMRRLTAKQRDMIRDAMRNAIAELRRSLDTADLQRLYGGLEKMVWAPAS